LDNRGNRRGFISDTAIVALRIRFKGLIPLSQLPSVLIPVIITTGINSILKCPFRRAHSHPGVGFSSLSRLSSACSRIRGLSRFLRVIDGLKIAGEEKSGEENKGKNTFKIGHHAIFSWLYPGFAATQLKRAVNIAHRLTIFV
jgi:hypothetical protein